MSDREYMKRFAGRLRELRSNAGMSQEQLAHAAGLHRTHISLIERNRRLVRLETVIRLARALELQPADLMPELRAHDVKGTRPSPRQKRT
jgi:transcriptional regulator with XRE-family HTH domain